MVYALKIDDEFYCLESTDVEELTRRTFHGEISPRDLIEQLMKQNPQKTANPPWYIDVDEMVTKGSIEPILRSQNPGALCLYQNFELALTGKGKRI